MREDHAENLVKIYIYLLCLGIWANLDTESKKNYPNRK